MRRICKHGACWKKGENEQWQEVISKQNERQVKKANQASLLKNIVEVKDKWVKVRDTMHGLWSRGPPDAGDDVPTSQT